MGSRRSELNGAGPSGYAAAEPQIGDVIETGLTALDAGLPLRLKGVVRDRTTDGLRVEFLANTPDERRELSLFRQFRGGLGLRESDYPRFVHIVTKPRTAQPGFAKLPVSRSWSLNLGWTSGAAGIQ